MAQSFPTKPVRIAVPFGAGGVADLTARTVAQKLSKYWAGRWRSKTPKSVIARLNRDILAAVNAPDVKKKPAELNVEARSSSPEQAAELLASEVKRWGEVIQRAKIPQQ